MAQPRHHRGGSAHQRSRNIGVAAALAAAPVAATEPGTRLTSTAADEGCRDDDGAGRSSPAAQVRAWRPPNEGSLAGRALIKVFGVGGGGCNAVNQMIKSELTGVEFWAVNTDLQALNQCLTPHKVQIGRETTRGRGTGGSSLVGDEAAREALDDLIAAVAGADLVFVAAGMGGGTGSGAGPAVARLAKANGALTIGIVTEPFSFEGRKRMQEAALGVEAMRAAVDTLVVVPNDRLMSAVSQDTPIQQAFRLADDVLRQGVQGISDIITVPGLVNVDFADVRAVMQNAGSAMLGVGIGSGKHRAEEAARAAIMSPLLMTAPARPNGVVYNITGGKDLTLLELNKAAEIVYEMADPNANVIFGAVIDDSSEGSIRMTVIATGFQEGTSGEMTSSDLVQRVTQGLPQSKDLDKEPLRGRGWLESESTADSWQNVVPEFLRRRKGKGRK
eukprot:SM000005S17234  [mRNA]  locus=s5:968080:970940:- [translate_table: standard]